MKPMAESQIKSGGESLNEEATVAAVWGEQLAVDARRFLQPD